MTVLTQAIINWSVATGETPKTIANEIDELVKDTLRHNPQDENIIALAHEWEEMRRKEGITL